MFSSWLRLLLFDYDKHVPVLVPIGRNLKLSDLEFLQNSSGTHSVSIIQNLQADWKKLIGHFHLPYYTIRVLRGSPDYSPEGACKEVFRQWLDGGDDLPTQKDWNTVITVMQCIGKSELAEKLREVLET